MHQSEEIAALYALYFSLELLHAEYRQEAEERCVHKVYRLQRSDPATPRSA